MPQAVLESSATVIESSGFANAATIRKLSDGAYMQQSDFGTIKRKMFKAGVQVGETLTLSVSTVVFDALQTSNPLWPFDTGYNFYDIVEDNVLTDGDVNYECWYEFEMTSLPVFRFRMNLYTLDVPGE